MFCVSPTKELNEGENCFSIQFKTYLVEVKKGSTFLH